MTVITTIQGYGDLFWTDVVAQMDAMNDTVVAFQAQAKKLPKASHNQFPIVHLCVNTEPECMHHPMSAATHGIRRYAAPFIGTHASMKTFLVLMETTQ